MKSWLSAALAGAALIVFTGGAEAANPRIALVIGESAYPDAPLPTAANDAGLVAQVLQAAGFDVVGARDLDQKSVRESLRDFLDKANQAGPDMQAFVYFSGRALQYSGDNYLAPIDARIARDSDVPIEAIKLSDFTHALAAAPGLARVVVIDGARPNPYAQAGAPLAGGLALVDPEPNTVIAFNAAPGAIGVDDAGDYGVYAKTLAGLMRTGGVDITEVLAQTRIQVNTETQGAQIPFSAGKLSAPYFLFERAADAPPPKRPPPRKPLKQLSAEDAYQVVIERDRLTDYEEFLRDHARSEQARRIEAILAARREAMFWRRALEQNSPRAYWTYLRRYPKGPHSYDADRRLDAIAARREPPPDFAVIEYEDLPPPPPREIVFADRPVYYFGGDDFGPPPPPPPRGYFVDADDDDWRALPPPPPPTIAGVLPVLAITIPLILTARAYHDRPDRDGRAPPSAPPPGPRPMGPPPLPRGVRVIAAPAPAPMRSPEPNGRGEVKFGAPPVATPGGRPPAPAPAPLNGKEPTPVAPGAKPGPQPLPVGSPEPKGPPTPTPGKSPLPSPTASPEPRLTPTPTPGGKPLPTPPATRAPSPTVSPEPKATPTPTPGKALPTPPDASPSPDAAAKPKPERTKGEGKRDKSKAEPTPAPSSPPEPEETKAPRKALPDARPKAPDAPDAPKAPKSSEQPKPSALPKPAELPKPSELPKPADTPKPHAMDKPRLKDADAPRPAKLQDADEPKPAKLRDADAPRPAKVKEADEPRPAPKLRDADAPVRAVRPVDAPRPAPKAVEAPRPAVQPAPRIVDAPRPAPQPAPRIVEAPRPAPPPQPQPAMRTAEPPKVAACGHPGQPRC